MPKTKFMQALDTEQYKLLKKLGSRRGIGVQELLRAIVIPEWINVQDAVRWKSSSNGSKKSAS